MKHSAFSLVVAAALWLLTACAGTRNVPYTVARNYFVNNNAPASIAPVITTKQQFDRYFGMATVMGRDGRPTEIDFSRQFVVAKVLPETDRTTELTPLSLRQTAAGELTLRYRVKRGERQSYTTRPMFLLCVPAKYKDCRIVEQEE